MHYFVVNNLLICFITIILHSQWATAQEPALEDLKNLREQYNALKADNEFLKQESQDLNKRADELQSRLDVLERLNEETARVNRRNNLVLYGIQNTGVNEKPLDLVKKIGDAINFPLTDKDIVDCYRLQSNERNRNGDPILVKFTSADVKDLFMKKMKSQELTAAIIGGDRMVKIYVNEHLTKLAATLFREALNLKSNGYPFVWTKNGYVYVKKGGEESQSIRIETIEQVQQLEHLVIERIKKAIRQLEQDNYRLEKNNIMLETRLKDLQERLRDIENSREESERTQRINNVILYGIPYPYHRETPANLIQNLEYGLNFTLCGKFLTCYRLRPGNGRNNTGAPVLIKFLHPSYKQEFITHMKSRIWTADKLGGSPTITIYINEHLTPHRAILYREACNLQARGKLFTWIHDGRIYVTKNKTSSGVEVHNLHDLREVAFTEPKNTRLSAFINVGQFVNQTHLPVNQTHTSSNHTHQPDNQGHMSSNQQLDNQDHTLSNQHQPDNQSHTSSNQHHTDNQGHSTLPSAS